VSAAAVGQHALGRRPGRLIAAVAAVAAVAFGGAFAIGRATAEEAETGDARPAERVDLSSETPQVTDLKAVGTLPGLREPPPSPEAPAGSTGSSPGPTTSEPPATSGGTPPAAPPATSAPAPAPAPTPPAPDPGPQGGGDG
jgi:hypothetical protein